MPTRRALLLGARAPDLEGVEHDVELMHEALSRHGFANANIDTVFPACREGIIEAMQRLIATTKPDDAVLIYYSGHGARLERLGDGASRDLVVGEAAYYRFLVPSDFELSTEDDFCGYTNVELSLDLAALTRKSKNLVAIMDCCYAGRIFRAGPSEPRAHLKWQDTSKRPAVRYLEVTDRWLRSAERHYEKLRELRQLDLSRRHAEANPWAVRLLASAATSTASETVCTHHHDCANRFAGVMTLALYRVLMRVDPAHTSWQDVGRMIRQTPQRGSRQRVAIEGPCRRLLFSLCEREQLDEFDIQLRQGRVLVAGGRLVGIAPGDRYELFTMVSGVQVPVGESVIETVASSHAQLRTESTFESLAPGSSARLLSYASARAAVEFVGIAPGTKEHELLSARVTASGFVRVVEPGAELGELPLAGRICLGDDRRLQLWSDGVAFDCPRIFDPGCSPTHAEQLAEYLAESVRSVARAACLRALARSALAATELLEPGWELTWALIENGRIGRMLEPNREQLRVGDRFTLWLRSPKMLYLSAFMLRADARIELLTQAQAGGVEIEPGTVNYLLGQRSGASRTSLSGVEISRPRLSIIRSPALLPGALVLVVSDAPVDVRSWEQLGISRFVPRDLLKPHPSARNLSTPPPPLRPARYHVETWTFQVQ